MAVVPIIKIPDEILNQKSEKVGKLDEATKNLIKNLLDTLQAAQNPEGSGLAAPQIGILKRVCIARKFLPNPNNPNKPLIQDVVLINPKIISSSKDVELGWEGCLSIPDEYGKVQRTKKVKIKALNEEGEEVRINASGFFARVIQHEIDHLEGILFTSKLVGNTITEKELDKILEKEKKTAKLKLRNGQKLTKNRW